jgi:hypothetical protein
MSGLDAVLWKVIRVSVILGEAADAVDETIIINKIRIAEAKAAECNFVLFFMTLFSLIFVQFDAI